MVERDPHAERPDWPLPGGEWPSVDAAQAWFIAEEKRLGWTHREWERAYYNIHSSGGGKSGQRPQHPTLVKSKLDRFKEKGRGTIPGWLYWMPLAIRRVAEVGWDRGTEMAERHVLDWDYANIPGYLPHEHDDDYGDLLGDDEISVLDSFRCLDANMQVVARYWLDHPEMLRWWSNTVIAANQGNEPVRKALDFLLAQKFD